LTWSEICRAGCPHPAVFGVAHILFGRMRASRPTLSKTNERIKICKV